MDSPSFFRSSTALLLSRIRRCPWHSLSTGCRHPRATVTASMPPLLLCKNCEPSSCSCQPPPCHRTVCRSVALDPAFMAIDCRVHRICQRRWSHVAMEYFVVVRHSLRNLWVPPHTLFVGPIHTCSTNLHPQASNLLHLSCNVRLSFSVLLFNA